MKSLIGAALGTLAWLFPLSSQAATGDRPFRVANFAQSRSTGIGRANALQVERLPGPGREQVMNLVVSRFSRRPLLSLPTPLPGSDSLMARGEGWFAEVRGTGEWIRFRDEAYIDGPLNKPIPMAQRPSGGALEARAREVLAKELSAFVQLGPNERLESWSVSRLVNSSVSASGEEASELVASRVLFTRVLDGVPVLGAGSKVSVIFANDGKLVGFDLDFPQLKLGPAVKVVGMAEIQARTDILFGRKTSLQSLGEGDFECGYFDPGVAGLSTTTLISPGCVATSSDKPSTQIVVPLTEKW
jgi:hypothetical protein